MRTRALLYSCIVLLWLCRTDSSIASYMEVFDGQGPYDASNGTFSGLYEANWMISGFANEELTSEGLAFDADPFPLNIQSAGIGMTREVEGTDPFRLRLVMDHLAFGLPTENLSSSVSLACIIHLDPFPSNSVAVSLSATETELWLSATSRGSFGTKEHRSSAVVGNNSHLGSRTELYVTLESSQVFVEFYGESQASITLSIPYDGNWSSLGHVTECYAGATATGSISGVFREISEFPLDTAWGDFNGNLTLDAGDVDFLVRHLRQQYDAFFDLNLDGAVDFDDVSIWIHDVRVTYFGDANLDGEFNSVDLISAFQAGEYEDAINANSTWSTGDWNGDGEFTTGDLVVAFQDGGYEQGRREAVSAVPEPRGLMTLLIGTMGFFGVAPLWRTLEV